MARPRVGEHPMTPAERQRRRRARLRHESESRKIQAEPHIVPTDRIAAQKAYDVALLEWQEERDELVREISRLRRENERLRAKVPHRTRAKKPRPLF